MVKIGVGLLLIVMWLGCLFFNKVKYWRGVQLTKPFLMPLLLVLYLILTPAPRYLVVLALICGFVGDVALLWVEKRATMLTGLVAFLIGHILYVVVFLDSTHFLSVIPTWVFLLVIPYILYGIWVYRKLAESVGTMRVPVLIYLVVILSMSFTALSRFWAGLLAAAVWLPFIGSLLFMVSDTVLAMHIFRREMRYGNVWIMATYVAAQMLIVFGLI